MKITPALVKKTKTLLERHQLPVAIVAEQLGMSPASVSRIRQSGYDYDTYKALTSGKDKPKSAVGKKAAKAKSPKNTAEHGVHVFDNEEEMLEFLSLLSEGAAQIASEAIEEVRGENSNPRQPDRKDVPYILLNQVKCLACGKFMTSSQRHDYVECGCENHTMTDGGRDYVRQGGMNADLVQDRSVYSFTKAEVDQILTNEIKDMSFFNFIRIKRSK
jgi:hypothetical protein